VNAPSPTPEQWLAAEDQRCLEQRAARLAWLLTVTPPAKIWLFPGGWLGQQLFEEARYCFVYGQFVASAVLGFAFVERTLAAMHYGSGRNDLQRATSEKLFKEGHNAGWLSGTDLSAFEKARKLRNPLVHFRTPLHAELPESRSFAEVREPHEVVETDAKAILEAVFRLVARNAVG
jgi:hypothetical protein